MQYENRGAVFGALFARKKPDYPPNLIGRDVAKLIKVGRALQRLAVDACNVGLTGQQERRVERYAKDAVLLANKYGFDAEPHGDPRGHVLRLVDPDNKSSGDSFAGGWGVY